MRLFKILFFVFISLLLSCNRGIDKADFSRIEIFEKILGEPENLYLNEIIDDFETVLRSKYKRDINISKFKQYLLKISKFDISAFWRIDSTKLKKYRNSNLFAKYDTIFPDSVWWEDGVINLKFKESEIEECIIPVTGKTKKINIDSIIKFKKQEPRRRLVKPSNFISALNSVKHDFPLVSKYLDAKKLSGHISPSVLVDRILYNYSESNEYFCKCILIMELCD